MSFYCISLDFRNQAIEQLQHSLISCIFSLLIYCTCLIYLVHLDFIAIRVFRFNTAHILTSNIVVVIKMCESSNN